MIAGISKRRAWLLGPVLAALIGGCATEREIIPGEMSRTLLPPKFGFFIADHPSGNRDSSDVILLARVRYDDFIFLKSDSGFDAHYQFTVSAYADQERTNLKYSKFYDHRIHVGSFQQTISTTTFDTLRDEFRLRPGTYYFTLRFYDLNTGETSTREFSHEFKDFSNLPISISNVLLYSQRDTAGEPVETARNRFDTLYARFYVVCREVPDTVSIHVVARSTTTPTYIDTTYEFTQGVTVEKYGIPLRLLELAPATYDLRITAAADGEESSSEAMLLVPRSAVPLVPAEMDQAIGPLEYIADGSVISQLRKGTLAERQRKFRQFWLARARGDSATAYALMNEFYRRVDYANSHFRGGAMRGWQSDQGRIYIVYGPPDDIQNRDSGFNAPAYQIWLYYSSRMQFVFYDEFGTGDYRLVSSGGF